MEADVKIFPLFHCSQEWWQDGELAVLDLAKSSRQIGEKQFVLLASTPTKEPVQFSHDYEAGNLSADISYTTPFRNQYFIPKRTNQPLTEIQESDLCFCIKRRFVTVRSRIIPLTVKEFDMLFLLILHPGRMYSYEVIPDLV